LSIVNSGLSGLGVYIHIPFCRGKCPYCDFYSLRTDERLMDRYTESVCGRLSTWAEELNGTRTADTLYFGGGTPGLLGAERLSSIINTVKNEFPTDLTEITVEINPSNDLQNEFERLSAAGVNRISIGLQSAVQDELDFLGRTHTPADVISAVGYAKRAGIENISLDLMLGLQNQTTESIKRSIYYISELKIRHISAYLLKIEPGTPFYDQRETLNLPGEEAQRELYLYACEALEQAGFMQYEISNFANKGYECRHNLKYWNAEEYLGIGPAAHSFLNGRRFYYPRDIQAFMDNAPPTGDGAGGSYEEYAMLRLRLTEGLTGDIPPEIAQRAKPLQTAGLLVCDESGIRLTREGFLVSNAVISNLLNF